MFSKLRIKWRIPERQHLGDVDVPRHEGATTEVERYLDESLIERKRPTRETPNACFVTERFAKRFSERN